MFKNFDFSWFLTTPGILTGVGCLLILISIIIFLSSLKGKKKNKEEAVEANQTAEVPDANPVNLSTEPINFAKTMEPTPIVNNNIDVNPEVAPVTPVNQNPEVTPVNVETVVTPVEPVQPEPVSMQSVTPTVNPINIEPQITPVQTNPQPEPVSIQPVQTPAYPETPQAVLPEGTKNIIYGGADPINGTGIMPQINPEITKKDDIESL